MGLSAARCRCGCDSAPSRDSKGRGRAAIVETWKTSGSDGEALGGGIYAVAVQPDGKILGRWPARRRLGRACRRRCSWRDTCREPDCAAVAFAREAVVERNDVRCSSSSKVAAQQALPEHIERFLHPERNSHAWTVSPAWKSHNLYWRRSFFNRLEHEDRANCLALARG